VNAKFEGIMKHDTKNSSDIFKDVIEEIEREIGAKLGRT
jgi:hypothetical protein